MISITNTHRADLEFMTGVKAGEPTFETVKAGETKNVAISAEDNIVVARVNAGMITVAATRRGRPSAGNAQ